MAGLHDTEMVDVIAQGPDGNALLVIIKEGEWEPLVDGPALRDKFNTYAQFILDGGLVSHYPHLDGRPVAIRVDSRLPPPPAMTDILRRAREQLRKFDIAVTESINPNL